MGMFHLRDPRGGKGRVAVFHALLVELHGIHPNLAMTMLPLVPEYGSWDDLFTIAANFAPFKHEVLTLAEKQLVEEEIKLTRGEPLSMFAKWVPDEKKALKEIAVEFAYHLMKDVVPPPMHSQVMASYRRRINRLNAVVNPVEIYECAGRWDEIDPTTVAAGALKMKRGAYLNERNGTQRSADEKRVQCAEKFKEFFGANPPTKYEKLEPSSERYDPVRDIVDEWVQGGWRI